MCVYVQVVWCAGSQGCSSSQKKRIKPFEALTFAADFLVLRKRNFQLSLYSFFLFFGSLICAAILRFSKVLAFENRDNITFRRLVFIKLINKTIKKPKGVFFVIFLFPYTENAATSLVRVSCKSVYSNEQASKRGQARERDVHVARSAVANGTFCKDGKRRVWKHYIFQAKTNVGTQNKWVQFSFEDVNGKHCCNL